jgi:hypothetical protein
MQILQNRWHICSQGTALTLCSAAQEDGASYLELEPSHLPVCIADAGVGMLAEQMRKI